MISTVSAAQAKVKEGSFQLRENDGKNCKAKHWRHFRIVIDENGEQLPHMYCCSAPNCYRIINSNLAKDKPGKLSRRYKSCQHSDRIGIKNYFDKECTPPVAKKIKLEHKTAVDKSAVFYVVADMKPLDSIAKPGLISLLSKFTAL